MQVTYDKGSHCRRGLSGGRPIVKATRRENLAQLYTTTNDREHIYFMRLEEIERLCADI